MISHHPDFLESSLEKILETNPLGFIDVGSRGGVHGLILPLASRSQCTCFEPDPVSYRELTDMYRPTSPFSSLTIHQTALGAGPAQANLYVTKNPVNTSLLEPVQEIASRYEIPGLCVDKVSSITTDSLDRVLAAEERVRPYAGEFIKLDCQGAEFDILTTGARETLEKECVAVFCEVRFAPWYRNEKVFSEIDTCLNSKGFSLYGLQPHFMSTRRLDRLECETEERLVWADALYFKDPLEAGREKGRAPNRKIQALFLVALLTHYYDYAMEILEAFDWTKNDRKHLASLVLFCSRNRKEALEGDADKLVKDLRENSASKYLIAKKFIDAHRSNSDINFLAIDHLLCSDPQ
jgi:FkbM family methyltransferase